MPAFSRQQLDRFLRRPLTARIATLLANGTPVITPVWFEWDAKSGDFLLWARKGYGGRNSAWYDNLTKDRRITILIDESTEVPPKHDRVLAFGKAELLSTPKNWLQLQVRMTRRYLGAKRAREYLRTMPTAPGGWVRVTPDRIITWTEKATNVWHPRYLKLNRKAIFEENSPKDNQ
jgi:nitroimidazol reductase NimA-like FMN-containing flavoprotein (pyridoxamine 5'-phosphate oxidase superfamily)